VDAVEAAPAELDEARRSATPEGMVRPTVGPVCRPSDALGRWRQIALAALTEHDVESVIQGEIDHFVLAWSATVLAWVAAATACSAGVDTDADVDTELARHRAGWWRAADAGADAGDAGAVPRRRSHR
jgi:hypothetical protein